VLLIHGYIDNKRMDKSGYGHTQDIVKDPNSIATPPSDNDKGDSSNSTNAGKTASKSGAYGGAELGSMVGGAVGPPIIGGIVGTLVGEMVGEKAIQDMGLDRKVAGAGDSLAGVIGERNVNKVGDIVLTAFGYSDQEVCVCCPCLPASQVLLVLTLPFFLFNWIKLGERES